MSFGAFFCFRVGRGVQWYACWIYMWMFSVQVRLLEQWRAFSSVVPNSTLPRFANRLALDNIGWIRTERKSCFPMSLTSSSSSRDRNKYVGIWRWSINFFKGCSLCYCDAIYRRVLPFVCSMNDISPYLFRSREDDDDVRESENTTLVRFYFPLCYLMLPLQTANWLSCTSWVS